MSNSLGTTLLATSANPLSIESGFPTLKTSLDAVAYDKAFKIVDWSTKEKLLGITIWKVSLNIDGRLFIGVAGPAYAVRLSPTASYVDGAITSTSIVAAGRETVTKHLPRTVTVDSMGEQEVYGGFVMGIWLYLSVSTSGSIIGKKWDKLAETQINLLDTLLQAGLLIGYFLSGNEAAAESEAATLTGSVTKACKEQAQYVGLSFGIGALDGAGESFFASKTSGLDGSGGVAIDPTCAIDLNIVDFIPGVATVASVVKTIGLKLYVGPYIHVHFPITTTITALSVNGQSGGIASYSPLKADVGPSTSASGSPGTVNCPDPAVTTPTAIGITLSAVPSIDLELGFEASFSFGKYFNKTWKVDLSADMTKAINTAFGTIPSKVVNSLANDIGSTSASGVTRT